MKRDYKRAENSLIVFKTYINITENNLMVLKTHIKIMLTRNESIKYNNK